MLRYRAHRITDDGMFDLLVVGLTRADIVDLLMGASRSVNVTGEPPEGFGVTAPTEVVVLLWADTDDDKLARRFLALQEAMGA